MSTAESKSLVTRYWDAINQRDSQTLNDLLHPDFVVHMPGLPGPVQGRDAWLAMGDALFAAFPDLHTTHEKIIAEGDYVAARVTWRGTHQQDMMGIPATGKTISVNGMRIARVAGDQVVEEWAMDDMLGMMQQLGLLPAPDQDQNQNPA